MTAPEFRANRFRQFRSGSWLAATLESVEAWESPLRTNMVKHASQRAVASMSIKSGTLP
jgi:hypothetical protein